MICLCYSKEKGLFIVDEKLQKRDDVVVIKSHESKGFKTIKGLVPDEKFKIEVDSNFGYGRGSYLSVRLLLTKDKGKKYILNFDKTLHEHRGMRLDTVCAFFFDPDAEDKWEKVFNFIISVFNKRDEQKFVGVLQYIGDICNDLRIGADRLKQGNDVLLEDAYGYGNLPYRCNDLFEGLEHSFVPEDNVYIHSFKARLEEKSTEYIKAAQQWLLSNNCIHELKYRVVRVLADKIIKRDANLEEELVPLHIRKIDHCQSLRQIKDSSIWYGQWNPIYAMSISDKTNAEISLFGESESSHFEGAWMFIDNSVDEYLKTPDGVESFWTLLPSKSPDSDVFTISHEKGKYQVVRLVDSKLQEIDLGHTYTKIGGFNHDLALVQQGNLFGIVDINGNIVVDVKYDYIADFYQNWSDVIRLDKDGVIMQENLKSLIEQQYVNSVVDKGLHGKLFKQIDSMENVAPLIMPIKTVGCERFRKFIELKELPVSQVNFIVGANNAGKSTFIQLIELLMHDINLLSKGFNSFNELIAYKITSNPLAIVKWGTQGSNLIYGEIDSKGKKPENKEGEKDYKDKEKECCLFEFNPYRKYITRGEEGKSFAINMSIGDITFTLSLNSDSNNCFIKIEDNSGISFTLHGSGEVKTAKIIPGDDNSENEGASVAITRPFSIESILNSIYAKIELSVESLKLQKEAEATLKKDLIKKLSDFYTKINTSVIASTDVRHIGVWEGKVNMEYCRGFFDDNKDSVIDKFIKDFGVTSKSQEEKTKYIHAIKEARDKVIIPFIEKWLHKMEIGTNFSVHHGFGDPKIVCKYTVNGKAADMPKVFIEQYLGNISDELSTKAQDEIKSIYIDGERDVRSAGTGTQHLVSLIFTISRIMLENILRDQTLPVLLVEEPEQNLHPKLQSLLADFFWDVTRVQKRILKDYGMSGNKEVRELQIIVETHSEYLIRRSQRYVKTFCSSFGSIEENPFRTFYFPEDDAPYDMTYTESGRFAKEFGIGFFDEAARLSFDISSL